MTEGYSLREVGKLLGLPRSVVNGLIEAGFVVPARGRRREYRFSFHDLVLLRAAQGLSEAKIPPARIVRSLRRLRAQLPEEVPLTGLRIAAVGDAVVVSEGDAQWRPDNGQYVLQFQVASPGGRLSFFDTSPLTPAAVESQWFERGLALEGAEPEKACDAYRRALVDDPSHLDAYVNLGRLLHELGHLSEAQAVYRDGLERCGADATLLFNLAVLQEDQDRPLDAMASYRAALAAAPDLSDAHFNLARLCEARGMNQEALRHWSAFRKLTGSTPK
ncbi:MAG TPA: tetratricopeptide repeat protein [Casimicrobiaceae bacterium]